MEQRGMSPVSVTARVKGTTITGNSIADIKAECPQDAQRIWELQLQHFDRSEGLTSPFSISLSWHQTKANHEAMGGARISGSDETRVFGTAAALRRFLEDRVELPSSDLPSSLATLTAPPPSSSFTESHDSSLSPSPSTLDATDQGELGDGPWSRSRRFLRNHWFVTIAGGVAAGLIVAWLTTLS